MPLFPATAEFPDSTMYGRSEEASTPKNPAGFVQSCRVPTSTCDRRRHPDIASTGRVVHKLLTGRFRGFSPRCCNEDDDRPQEQSV